MRYHAMRYDTMRYHTMQYHAIPFNIIRSRSILRRYGRFREGTRSRRQKVFPHPTVRAPSASKSPSALSTRAGQFLVFFICVALKVFFCCKTIHFYLKTDKQQLSWEENIEALVSLWLVCGKEMRFILSLQESNLFAKSLCIPPLAAVAVATPLGGEDSFLYLASFHKATLHCLCQGSKFFVVL